ncbi:MAG: hypothetical protein ABIQ40_01750 [Bacteroidia bacterium]
MKQVFILFVFFFTFTANAQLNPDKNADRNLYCSNKVKSVTMYECNRKTNAPCRNETLISKDSYDTTGLLIDSYFHFGWMHDAYYHQFEYDSFGNVVSDISFYNKEPFMNTFTYTYEGNKPLSKKKNDEAWYYSYDNKGNRITEKWLLNGDNYPNSFFLDSFQFNAKNQAVKMTRYNNDGSCYFYFIYQYDDAGNRISEARFQNNEMTDMWEHYFDGNHHKTGWAHYSSKMEKTAGSYFENVYDQNGLLISSVVNKRYRRYVYEYYQ